MIKSVYLDTSVFGGYFDEEFSEPTVIFFERIISDKITVVMSDILDAELESAPNYVKDLVNIIPKDQLQSISINNDIEFLAKMYIDGNVVGKTSYADCLHIALATISNTDILVSWNFKHIVNVDKIRGYNSVNLKLGYKLIDIYSPLELGKYEWNRNKNGKRIGKKIKRNQGQNEYWYAGYEYWGD